MASITTIPALLEERIFPRKGVCEPTKKVERFFEEYFRKHPLSREELLEVQRQKRLELPPRRTRSVGRTATRTVTVGVRSQSDEV